MREVFVRLANPAVEAADQIAATARLAGGAPFTGSGRHFVPARDARAPLGYDTAATVDEDGDFTLYTEEGRTTFRQEGDLSLERLLLRLELRRHPGGAVAHARGARGGLVYVSARRGLALPLIDRLFAAGVDGQAAICEGGRPSPFATAPGFWLLRLPELPPRLFGLCTRTPGTDAVSARRWTTCWWPRAGSTRSAWAAAGPPCAASGCCCSNRLRRRWPRSPRGRCSWPWAIWSSCGPRPA